MAFTKLQLARRYLHYFITASNGRGHGIHSPFVFDFVTNVLNDRRRFYVFDRVEAMREQLKLNHDLITVNDRGAGSRITVANNRKISSIARHSVRSAKWGQLLFRIGNYFQPSTVIELGTSLGISTAYLAAGNPAAHVVSVEGVPAIASIARENLRGLGVSAQVNVIEGNFDDVLPGILEKLQYVDLALIDGNHREEPTICYFHQLLAKRGTNAVFVFDDIHWSIGMEAAWAHVCAHPDVFLTIDLFCYGLVFFNDGFKARQHFAIRF